jgi:hypothetical protein
MKQRVWVIAGNEHQYHDYVRGKPLNGDKKYSYVYRPETLRGFANPHGVFIGTWKGRDDIIQILDMLIISTHDNTDKLQKIRMELMANATHTQMHSVAIANASDMFAKAIDQQVLDQLTGYKSKQNPIAVFLNGVLQAPADYSVSGNTVRVYNPTDQLAHVEIKTADKILYSYNLMPRDALNATLPINIS